MLLIARNIPATPGKWRVTLVSGLLPVNNAETNLGKLTLSFSLSASLAKPVAVRVEFFNAAKRRTGELSGLIYPAAPDFFQRYALDLSTLKPVGAGKFQPAGRLCGPGRLRAVDLRNFFRIIFCNTFPKV